MCGICGWVHAERDRPVSEEMLRSAARRMAHRGPDGEGVFAAPGVGLAMRRLAVIDLADGAQPMTTADRRFTLVYNGECYNHRELRHELERHGRRFRTRCDTEVVLEGFAAWGEKLLGRMNGMYAFAVWDAEERCLFLARDRLGIKPLYLAERAGTLAFASEIRCLFADPSITRAPDRQAVADFLTFKYVPAPRTGFAGVAKLPAGHWARYREGRLETRVYWDALPGPPLALSEAEAEERIGTLLRRAVKARLMSDVPLGVMLSGGVDSSLVAGAAAREQGGIDTFTIGFDSPEYDESEYAWRVAERIGSTHHEQTVRTDSLADLDALARSLEEPHADSAALPLRALCAMTRQHVTVALAGDGGDELGGGYPRYYWDARARAMGVAPGLLPGAAMAGRLLQRFAALREMGRRVEKFASTAALPEAARYASWFACFTPREKEELLTPEMRAAVTIGAEHEHFAPLFERAAGASPLARLRYVDIKSFLADDLLLKADKLSMAVSLELRVPFLDVAVVEAMLALPDRFLVAGGELKRLLRRLCAPVAPEAVHRPKQGFSVPLRHWFREGVGGPGAELLDETRLRAQGFVRPEAVAGLRARAALGRTDVGHQLYALLALSAWHRVFFESGAGPEGC